MSTLDPQDLYELDSDRPDLTGVVLVHALDGISTAGSAVELARKHLVNALDGRVLVEFDVDQLFDYRARRPLMRFARDHWESYDTPHLQLHLLDDDAGVPFLLLTGPEPDVQWERFITAVTGLVDQLGVRLSVGLNAFPMAPPHTRPTHVIVHGSRPELVTGYEPWLGTIAVPASISNLLELRLGEAGHDALGLTATVPPYLAQAEYPATSAALLRAVGERAGLTLPVAALDAAADTFRVAIDEQVAKSPELTAMVEALEQQHDAYYAQRAAADPLLADGAQLPSADDIGAELERYLAEQSKGQ